MNKEKAISIPYTEKELVRVSTPNYPTVLWRPHLVVLGSGIEQTVMDDGCHPFQHRQNQVRRDAEGYPLGSAKQEGNSY